MGKSWNLRTERRHIEMWREDK